MFDVGLKKTDSFGMGNSGKIFGLTVAALLLGACSKVPTPTNTDDIPRIVSLDYCADQYVLKLAPREWIVALSPHAKDDYSYLRNEVGDIPLIPNRAEDILLTRPTLVVRSYGGGPMISGQLERAGIQTVQLGYISDLDGVKSETLRVATELGVPERGKSLVAEMDQLLSQLPASQDLSALYITPGGVTAGQGTMVDSLITASGLTNAEDRQSWVGLPLETIARQNPDIFITSFYDTTYAAGAPWSSARHPVMRRALKDTPTVRIDGAWTACGAWFLVDAVEAIAEAGEAL